MKTLLQFLILFLLAIPAWAVGQSDSISEIENLLEKEEKSFDHGGFSFAMTKGSHIVLSRGYGWADKKEEKPMTAASTTAVASVTKLFTATAVVQLADQGLLDLDAPITDYIDSFSLADGREEEVTLRRILTHYSPLPSDYLKGYMSPYVPEKNVHDYMKRMIEELALEQSASPADTVYRYSNTGYELAAYIVHRQTGMPFPAYVRKNILEPLGMDDSGFPYAGGNALTAIKGYDSEGEAPPVPMRGTGEGDLISTAEDLTRFGQLFLSEGNGAMLSREKVTEMLSRQNETASYDFDLYRGLGWYRSEVPGYPGHHYYYHEGGTHPYSALLAIVPELDMTLAFTANEGEHSFDSLSVAVLQALFEEKTGDKPQLNEGVKTAEVDEKYYGVYSTEMGIMEISGSSTGPVLEMMGMKLHITRKTGGFYGLQLRLLGLIPLPISDLKSITFQFDDRDIPRFGIYTDGKYRGLGTLVETKTLNPRWEDRFGEYEIVNGDGENFLSSFKLSVDPGSEVPLMTVSVATIPGEMSFPLNLSQSGFATIEGYGRHMGDRITVERQGDKDFLRYSGYYLQKK